MNCDFVHNRLRLYFGNNLSEEELKLFTEHTNNCVNCQEEINNHKKYFTLLMRAEPGFDPPENLIEKISDGLMGLEKDSEEIKKLDKKEFENTIKKALKASKLSNMNSISGKSEKFRNLKSRIKKILWIILITMGFAAAGILIYLNISFSNEPWKLNSSSGEYSINGSPSNSNELFKGDILLTGENTSSKIDVPKTSSINVCPKSQLVILSAEEKNNIIRLIRGDFNFRTYSKYPFLVVEIENILVLDHRANYSTQIDNEKNLVIEVLDGFVEVKYADLRIPIGRGYKLEIKNGNNVGVPYRISASPVLIEELNKYLFESGGLESLQNLLSAAAEEDAITLWSLIRRVNKNEILMLYDKLNNFYPVPDGVTKRLVMNLKQEILDLWWSEIEWQL